MTTGNDTEMASASSNWATVDDDTELAGHMARIRFVPKVPDCPDWLAAPRDLLAGESSFFSNVFAGGYIMDVDLPSSEYEPKLMMHALDFMYRGNYKDGEFPAVGRHPFAHMHDSCAAYHLLEPDGCNAAAILKSSIDDRLRGAVDFPFGGAMSWVSCNCPSIFENLHTHYGSSLEAGEKDVEDGDELNDSDNVLAEMQAEVASLAVLGGDKNESVSGARSSNFGMDIDYRPSMLISLRLYGLATHLGMPRLQLLVRRRLRLSITQHAATHGDFPVLVDQCFNLASGAPIDGEEEGRSQPATGPWTPAYFRPICDMLCNMVAHHMDSAGEDFRSRMKPVLERHQVLAEGVRATREMATSYVDMWL